MKSWVFGARGAWVAVLAGIAWAQAAIAVRLLVIPHYLALGERVADGWWYRAASWTLLAPCTLATLAFRGGTSKPLAADPTWLLAAPGVGVALCALALALFGVPKWQSWIRFGLLVVAAVGVIGGVAVAFQFRDVVRAERGFAAFVSRADVPHRSPEAVVAARHFATRYPNSAWAGEALRIVAMAESDAGRDRSAAQVWTRFGRLFRDPTAPGIAYAEYSIALCAEKLGDHSAESQHLRDAIEVIRARGDGTQAWIAAAAADRLSTIEDRLGRRVLAHYWKTKSETFKDVYTIE